MEIFILIGKHQLEMHFQLDLKISAKREVENLTTCICRDPSMRCAGLKPSCVCTEGVRELRQPKHRAAWRVVEQEGVSVLHAVQQVLSTYTVLSPGNSCLVTCSKKLNKGRNQPANTEREAGHLEGCILALTTPESLRFDGKPVCANTRDPSGSFLSPDENF